jgi:hypothetical protein
MPPIDFDNGNWWVQLLITLINAWWTMQAKQAALAASRTAHILSKMDQIHGTLKGTEIEGRIVRNDRGSA